MPYQTRTGRLGIVLAAVALLTSCATVATPTAGPTARASPTSERCTFAGTGATLAFEGRRLNFQCPPAVGKEIGLLGNVTLTERGWMLERAVIGRGDGGFVLEASTSVVISHIELADGTLCAFVGTGATLAFDGRRLNFQCPPRGGKEVGLLGEFAPADEGWTLELATIDHGDDGFELESAEQVRVAAVMVQP